MLPIYVLNLESNKYYVGKTRKTITDRFKEHVEGEGAVFTKKYKPVKIIKSFKMNNDFDEDLQILELMEQYGIENVRGGAFASDFLSEKLFLFLTK